MKMKKLLLALSCLALCLIGCQKKQIPYTAQPPHCYEYTIEGLITGSEYTSCSDGPRKGTIKFLIPPHWILDSTRQVEVRILQQEVKGEQITIGEVMNVTMNADPSEFSIFSKPQDLSEAIPILGYASWSWCLKPKRVGVSYLCFEVEIKGKEFGQKVLSKSFAIPIQNLPFWEGLAYFFLNNWQWLIPLGSFIIAVLAEIRGFIPLFWHHKIKQKLDGIEKKIDLLSRKNGDG